MNQNRNSNRRRGRGSNRGGGGNQSNRIDSRARGNAPQLLEKYRKLAHDASLNDDRVQTEYYLQFADHYFRVVADNKAQKEEARAKRDAEREPSYDDDQDDEDWQDDRGRDRYTGSRRSNRRNRDDRSDAEGGPPEVSEGAEGEFDDGDNPFSPDAKPKRARKRKVESEDDKVGLSADVLPPAIKGDNGGDRVKKPARGRSSRSLDDDGDGAMEAVG